MPKIARVVCLICGRQQLQPLINLSEDGIPHNGVGHNFTYSYDVMTVCENCGHGQLESYSHDCYVRWDDEDQEMYWWYALTPSDVLRLRDVFDSCPDWLNAACDCSVHHSLRSSKKRLWGGVLHAVSPRQKITFTWLYLEMDKNQVILKLDKEKGIGQAAYRLP